MGKVKVKKLNHKEEKTNPFDLRFNRVKHKIVNQKLNRSELVSNPYQSRNRANELRKKSLLVDYKNRNKTGSVRFVNETNKSPEDESTSGVRNQPNKNQAKQSNKRATKKDNAEYMSEMFEKKRLAQLERDKMDNLKDKLDDRWNQLKNSFLLNETSRKSNETKKIDSYDLIFNDLLINGGERYVPASN